MRWLCRCALAAVRLLYQWPGRPVLLAVLVQNTYIGEDWWKHGSSWFDIDVKGKGRYDQVFHTRMTGDTIKITVLNHFFPSEYQVAPNA